MTNSIKEVMMLNRMTKLHHWLMMTGPRIWMQDCTKNWRAVDPWQSLATVIETELQPISRSIFSLWCWRGAGLAELQQMKLRNFVLSILGVSEALCEGIAVLSGFYQCGTPNLTWLPLARIVGNSKHLITNNSHNFAVKIFTRNRNWRLKSLRAIQINWSGLLTLHLSIWSISIPVQRGNLRFCKVKF